MLRGLGWCPDLPDHRDHKSLTLDSATDLALPRRTNNRAVDVPIVDQLSTNSCVGNSLAQMVHFLRRKLALTPDFVPSRSFLYYFARRLEGWQDYDDGAYIRDGMKVLVADGICDEADWPFDVEKINERPPQDRLHDALAHRTLDYVRMKPDDNLYHLKHSLAQGFPFVMGISVYSSFMDKAVDNTGIVPMPKTNETLEGGHAIRAIDYDDDRQWVVCPNTWGTKYGNKGYYFLPYQYVANSDLADDFWTIRYQT